MDPVQIRITENLERNLDEIRRFLEELTGRSDLFARVVDELFEVVIPNLERFPALGRDFLARQPRSPRGVAQVERLRRRMGQGAELREYIFGDYLLLYTRRGATLYLLALRHHRQLSFDLLEHWL